MEESQENKKRTLRIFRKQDAPIYIAVIICLVVCAWTIHSVDEYRDQCNEYWISYLEEAKCEGFVKGVSHLPGNYTEPFAINYGG